MRDVCNSSRFVHAQIWRYDASSNQASNSINIEAALDVCKSKIKHVLPSHGLLPHS